MLLCWDCASLCHQVTPALAHDGHGRRTGKSWLRETGSFIIAAGQPVCSLCCCPGAHRPSIWLKMMLLSIAETSPLPAWLGRMPMTKQRCSGTLCPQPQAGTLPGAIYLHSSYFWNPSISLHLPRHCCEHPGCCFCL